MLTLVGLLVVVVVPAVALLGAGAVVEHVRRRRWAAIACQVRLTDALHRTLGAVASPTVKRRPWGRWRVVVPVPFRRPAMAGQVAAILQNAIADEGNDAPGFELVLTPRENARGWAA